MSLSSLKIPSQTCHPQGRAGLRGRWQTTQSSLPHVCHPGYPFGAEGLLMHHRQRWLRGGCHIQVVAAVVVAPRRLALKMPFLSASVAQTLHGAFLRLRLNHFMHEGCYSLGLIFCLVFFLFLFSYAFWASILFPTGGYQGLLLPCLYSGVIQCVMHDPFLFAVYFCRDLPQKGT